MYICKFGKYKVAIEGPGEKDNGFKSTPYFKVFTGNNFSNTKPEDRTRIAVNKAEYVSHPRTPGTMELKSKELKDLKEELSKEYTGNIKYTFDDGTAAKTNWDAILIMTNTFCNLHKSDKFYLDKNTPIPDYINELV